MTRSHHPEWEAEVLAQLDHAQSSYTLIGPGNAHFPSAALQVSGFVSDTEWLLAFQNVAWARRGSKYVRDLQLFGTDVGPDRDRGAELFADSRAKFWDRDGRFVADPHDFVVPTEQGERHFTPSADDYEQAGIDIDDMAVELVVLRFLAPILASQLLLSDAEILRITAKDGLSVVFSLSEWTHPDEADDEMPSQVPCFRAMAKALAESDPAGLDVCAEDANTDWRNWVALENSLS